MKKRYVVSMYAVRLYTKRRTFFKAKVMQGSCYMQAESHTEALEYATREWYTRCPPDAGWAEHSVNAIQLEDANVTEWFTKTHELPFLTLVSCGDD